MLKTFRSLKAMLSQNSTPARKRYEELPSAPKKELSECDLDRRDKQFHA
jgi:hypothetical protein